MSPHELLSKLPEALGVAVIGYASAVHVERKRAKAEERKTKVTEEGLDRRQIVQDAATMMDEMRAEMARYQSAKDELLADNRHLSAVVGDYREERLRLIRIADESRARIEDLQAKILALYEKLALAGASGLGDERHKPEAADSPAA
ncbi:hypothetical protein CCAX7_54320 [Capsulimonas corticalis]|uniref:Uncharacterized protein n=1 Tax=Capsulimonas corticalis TaxID=2219043 RepID=A0A402CN22_9BACT|nr:hypothetical protein [Capsulimonas corticalis]BDI33381.1 hypothetical protein CCAX7_54320 [Capsulimonas corticalis]